VRQHLDEIHAAFHKLRFSPATQLIAEPGRCLSAWHHSMLLRVEKRSGSRLYLNDGVFGTLSDAGRLHWSYFTRLLREPPSQECLHAFSAYGPTCDSLDKWEPMMLPADITVGDYVEILGLGAYGAVLRTPFNGCDTFEAITVQDRPAEMLVEEILGTGRRQEGGADFNYVKVPESRGQLSIIG
jgi:ornithine decarboxylase